MLVSVRESAAACPIMIAQYTTVTCREPWAKPSAEAACFAGWRLVASAERAKTALWCGGAIYSGEKVGGSHNLLSP